MSISFGAPKVYARMRKYPTPMELGIIQDCSFEASRDIKELMGQFAYPVAIGKGQGKCSGSLTLARFNPQLFRLALGGTVSAGAKTIKQEKLVVPADPFEITPVSVVEPDGDFGVMLFGATENENIQMEFVDTPTNSGEYNFDGTVYKFSAADAGKSIGISYQTEVVDGTTITVANELMGQVESFRLIFVLQYDGIETGYEFPNAMSGKFSIPFKRDDFNGVQLDYSAATDGAGDIIKIYNIKN